MNTHRHLWKFACKTPTGGDAGGDSVYCCVRCGMETLSPHEYTNQCYSTGAACPECSPHPKHKGNCRFACWCSHKSREERYAGALGHL